jgi:PAS domain S-box-containing protein
MLAHAQHIRRKLGDDVQVVFIGPCIAKKSEADQSVGHCKVNGALTFVELAEWFEREGIDLSACEESDFDETPSGNARLFPLEGGCVRTAGWSTDLLDENVVVASGFEEICTAFDGLNAPDAPHLIEPLFCTQGCINGPAMSDAKNLFARRGDILDYVARNPGNLAEEVETGLGAHFTPIGVDRQPFPGEQEIRAVLESTGKARDEDQLNCGACGYANCRDKAIAVIQGLAEREMCIPYMKRLAEQRVDRIIETSPNGIVILDEHLSILSMNPAFRRMFMCSDAVCNRPISYLVDPEPYERLAAGQDNMIEMVVEHKKYNLVCHQILYPMRDERQYVGIFVNITNSRTNERQLDRLREQTVLQARELLDHQIQMAETIARFLGESTAKGENLVEKLMLLAQENGNDVGRKSSQWLRDMYTSK